MAASATAAAPANPDWTEAGLVRFVDGWTAAQNASDFAAYEAFYAPRFSGVKRAGSYTAWFGRKGWIRDRKSMFKPGLRVEASDVTVALSSTVARVRFTQSFTLGGFHDMGRKELMLVKGAGGPLIAREEMLASRVEGAKPQGDGGAETLPGVFAVLGNSVYLGSNLGDDAVTGSPLLAKLQIDSAAFTTEVAVDTNRLAPSLRAFAGRTLKVVGVDGPVCEARVRDFAIRASGQPHFSTVQTWNGENDLPKATDAMIARDLWSMISTEHRYLVAHLDRDCPLGVMAFEDTVPVRIAPAKATEPVETAVLAAVRRLQEYKDIQHEFEQSGAKDRKHWDDGDAHVDVAVFQPSSGKKVALASLTSPRGGCADFWGALSVRVELDEAGPAPRVTRTDVLETEDGLTPKAAFDANGDGALEILTGPDGFDGNVVLWSPAGARVGQRTLFSTAYMDCPC